MLELDATEATLRRFEEQVIGKSKLNLKRKNKLASKRLFDSIDGELKVFPNSFQLTFFMEDYWQFVDYGVKGVGGTKADGSKWKKKRVTNNRFKYRDKKPPIFPELNSWTIRKGIAPRDSKGRFTKRRNILFAISNSIFHTGLETTHFFTKPFEEEFKDLPDELIEAYSLDLDSFLEFTLNG